ncbi:MAG: SIMPL domain-containing protein [Alphaproteobacteria bacterium]
MKKILALATLITLVSAASHAQMTPMPHPMRMISVTGEAHEDIVPDQAVLNISLVSRNISLQEAKQANDKLTEKLVAITKEFEIPKNDVATSNLYVSPEYNYDNGKQRLTGYVVNRSLRITMKKMDIHERLLSKVVEAGVDQVGGVEFGLADPESHMLKVRAKAFENAKAKAELLAKTAGMTLGKPISISLGGAQPPVMPMPMMAKMADAAMEMGGGSVAPSLPGMSTIREAVSVTFEME